MESKERERKHYHTYPSITRVGQRDPLHEKDGKTRTYGTNVGEKERLHPNSTPPVSFLPSMAATYFPFQQRDLLTKCINV